MKIFIFGAGASRGSQIGFDDDRSYQRAPLVNNLFDEQYIKFANDIGLSNDDLKEYRDSFISEGGSLEKWLTQKWEGIEKKKTFQAVSRERQTFGLLTYYIWWMMQKISSETYNESNAYNKLIKKIVNKEVDFGLINFNYDTLLDKAYKRQTGVILGGKLENYLTCKYIKPHGSVNWLLRNRTSDQLMDKNEVSFDTKVRLSLATSQMFKEEPLYIEGIDVLEPDNNFLNQLEKILSRSSDNIKGFYYPLVLLPLSSKLYDRVEGFKKKIIEAGRNMISEAREIFLIGYRAKDDVIKEMFENVKEGTLLHVVGRINAESIFNNVKKWSPGLTKGNIFNRGFEAFAREYNHLFPRLD